MIIEGGTGNGYKAGVDAENMLMVAAVTETHSAHISRHDGKTYTVVAEDAGPVATEYPFYLQYTGDGQLSIDHIILSNTDADVVWKIHEVTGTAATAAAIVAMNANLASGNVSDTNCLGGAGGVSGLTSVGVLAELFGGPAMSVVPHVIGGAIVLGKNNAIALEYDAGTGGKVAITVTFHEHSA